MLLDLFLPGSIQRIFSTKVSSPPPESGSMLSGVILWTACITFLLSTPVYAQYETTNDWDLTRAGQVRQVIQNRPHLSDSDSDYPGLIICEYPPGSETEHLDEASLFIGGVTPEGEIRVTAGESWCKDNEVWPGTAPWDSVWVVNRGDTMDIGGITEDGENDIYWPNYTAISDQDFVARYNDYQIIPPGGYEAHRPLYLDMLQQTLTWNVSVLENVVVWKFSFIPTEFNIEGMYIALRYRSAIAPADLRSSGDEDDISLYFPEHTLLASQDLPGGDDGTINSVIGFKIIPPAGYQISEDNYSFYWGGAVHCSPDKPVYETVMESHQVKENQQYGSSSRTWFSMGPIDVAKGDTVVYTMAQILADDIAELKEKSDLIEGLAKKQYKFPSSPPPPDFQVESSSKEVHLTWGNNAEQYNDPNRADSVEQPFEGYRVYKSTQSPDGPWTPLAQFDILGNPFGVNNGLEREYIDTGLLDNIEYYYSVTAFSKPDSVYPWPSVESSIYQNATEVVTGPSTPETVGEVAVVPNPYRGDIRYQEYDPPWEKAPKGRPWMEQDRRIQFINLPAQCEIKIYSASGDFIESISHNNPDRGFEDWNLTSYANQAIASGLYFFTVKDLETGKMQTGKFVVIK